MFSDKITSLPSNIKLTSVSSYQERSFIICSGIIMKYCPVIGSTCMDSKISSEFFFIFVIIKNLFYFLYSEKYFYVWGYISLSSVTLCRLGGPFVFIYAPAGGGRRGGGTVATRTTRLPPHERPPSRGSVPQPHQQFATVDPLTFHVPVVAPELRQQGMPECCLLCGLPSTGAVVGVGTIPQKIGKRGARDAGSQEVGDGHRSQERMERMERSGEGQTPCQPRQPLMGHGATSAAWTSAY